MEKTLNVNGLGTYWLTQAVDNIDSFMYIVKRQLTDQFKQEWYYNINTLVLENVVVIVYLKQILH